MSYDNLDQNKTCIDRQTVKAEKYGRQVLTLGPLTLYVHLRNMGDNVPQVPNFFLVTCQMRAASNGQILESVTALYGAGQGLKARGSASFRKKPSKRREFSYPLRQHSHGAAFFQSERVKRCEVLVHLRQLVQIVPTTNVQSHEACKGACKYQNYCVLNKV